MNSMVKQEAYLSECWQCGYEVQAVGDRPKVCPSCGHPDPMTKQIPAYVTTCRGCGKSGLLVDIMPEQHSLERKATVYCTSCGMPQQARRAA